MHKVNSARMLIALIVAAIVSALTYPHFVRYRAKVELGRIHDRAQKASTFAVRGRNNSLFYQETVRYCLDNWDKRADVRRFSGFDSIIRSMGIRLYIVPVPTKMDVYPELLVNYSGDCLCSARRRFINLMERAGLNVIDLMKVFYCNKKQKRLFARTDSHWDTDAIELAAEHIARVVEHDFPSMNQGKKYTTAQAVLTGISGDLGKIDGACPSDTLHLHKVIDLDRPFHGDDSDCPLFVYGDSFVKQYDDSGAGITAHLARRLHCSPGSAYSYGGFETAQRRIEKYVNSHKNVKVIIWIFTAHSLMLGWV
jgi:hypothetical protein